MRTRWRCGAAVLTLLGALDDGRALAQSPLDLLFGTPRSGRPHVRTYRGPRARAAKSAVRDVPLPVARPRFAGDTPSPEPSLPSAPAAGPGTTADKGAAQATRPPEPPPRPAELTPAVPSGPAKPAEAAHENTAGSPAKSAPPAASRPQEPRTPPTPAVAPSGAAAEGTPRQPADDPACPAQLKAMHVDAEPTTIGPQPDARCVVVEPVRLAGATLSDGTRIDFPDRPTLACVTAETFVRYVSQMLSPLAKGTYGAPVAAVWTGPGLECRSRDHIFGAKLSEHGLGLAIDIAQLKLANDRMIAVGAPKTPVDEAFEAAARAAGCGYFHTVLGPGSDSYHRTHWHFDLAPRGSTGDGKYCK